MIRCWFTKLLNRYAASLGVLIATLVVMLALGCTIPPTSANNLLEDIELNVHTTSIRTLTQEPIDALPDGRWLLSDGVTYGLYDPQTDRTTAVDLPNYPECAGGTKYGNGRVLPDGRLGFVRFCAGRWPEHAQTLSGMEAALYAYRLSDQSMERLTNFNLPARSHIRKFTWNPDMTRAIVNNGSLDSVVYWVEQSGFGGLNQVITDGRHSYNLAQAFEWYISASAEQYMAEDRYGIARSPDWSPNGDNIAFLATATVVERSGQSRAFAEYRLYLLNVETNKLSAVLGNLSAVGDLRWDPHSEVIAIHAGSNRNVENAQTILLYNTFNRTIATVARGSFTGNIFWTPERELVITSCLSEECLGPYEVRTVTIDGISDP